MNHPEVVDRLAILNAAHPRKLNEGLRHPSQLRAVLVLLLLPLPDLPEHHVRPNDWEFFQHFLRDAQPPYTDEEIERYIEAWSQPGAATAMIDYYRFAVRPLEARRDPADLGAHPGHLGREGSLPRPGSRRAPPRRRAQPRPRRAPARRVALGPPRRGRARQPAAHRLLRSGPHDVGGVTRRQSRVSNRARTAARRARARQADRGRRPRRRLRRRRSSPTVLRSFCCTAGRTTSTPSTRSRRCWRRRATG